MSGEDVDLQVDEGPPIDRRWRPTRLCVLGVAVVFLVVVLYWSFNNDTPLGTRPSHVSVFLDNSGPYSLTVSSDMDVVQEIDHGKTRVEISVRELLENKTNGPVRIVRSDGERYDVRLSYEPSASKTRLTRLDEIKPSSQNIFFIETRCGTPKGMEQYTVDSGVVLNARQICAIESTARLNPSRPVYLLHTCPLDDDFPSKSPEFVRQLITYNNVHVVMLDLAELFMRSIVEDLYFNSRFEESRHPVEHVSDVIRLLVLWRFGGTYMDIDVVSIRSLDELGTNYAGWQDEYTIASGVLNFAPDGFGHHILTECLFDLRDNFQPHEWSTNGPLLITKTIMRLCGITYGGERISRKCREFIDYPIPVFYPIYYTQWQLFFDEKQANRVLNLLNDTYVVHIWNKMSSQRTVRVGSGQAYGLLADKYCPKAYRNCGVKF